MSVVSLDSRRDSAAAALGKTHRLVVLESLYDNIKNDLALELFAKTARFKILGYQDNYDLPVLPVDNSDYIGTHILLCEKTEAGGLEPVMGYKIVTWDQCVRFGLEFPAFHVLGSKDAFPNHHAAIEAEVEKTRQGKEKLGYIGSWTVRVEDSDQRRGMARHCRDVSTATLVRMCEELGITRGITFAVRRFKVEKYHEYMGLKPLSLHGMALDPFPYQAFFGEICSASLLETRHFSEDARAMARRYEALWNERLVIRSEGTALKKAA